MSRYDELHSFLRSVRGRWARVALLTTASRAAAAAALPLLGAALVDYVLRPQGLALLGLTLTALTLAVAAASIVISRRPRLPRPTQVARFVEERAAALSGDRLDVAIVSTVEVAQSAAAGKTVPFIEVMVEDALRRIGTLAPSAIVPGSAMRAAAARAAAGAAIMIAGALAMAPMLTRAAETARLRFFPGSIAVHVLPGDIRLPKGASLRVHASLRGARGTLMTITPQLTISVNGEDRTVAMVQGERGFEYTLGSVDRSFTYGVTAGAAHSSTYKVTAIAPPRVERIALHYVYPSFSGLAPRDEENGGDIYAPAGTRVRLTIRADKPVVYGEIARKGEPRLSVRRAGDRTVEADVVVARDDSYRIRLIDADGLPSTGEAEYFIRVMDDRPPDVRILRPSADQQITPLEEVPIEARADDDYGIARFELVYSIAGGAEHVVPFERTTGTNVQMIGTRLLPAEELGVKPGDVIAYYARARDVARGKRPTEATSDMFFLEVKPFNEEFVSAQSQAGSAAGDPQIESLIDAQKAIIASTWNVERRSKAGRSAEDVKAIAQAQAELKGRTEQQLMGRAGRGRLRPPAPERAAAIGQRERRGAEDPIALAVEAMNKALQQLGADRTRDALPHEMAALNGLLQAQAEVRRRQVGQQSTAGAGNGFNRAGQDLSALFDKELQRQQRTNYETRSALETRPDREPEQSVLDRIRDLARRQEDLNQRQRDLANAQLPAEEMKRQLEKLTREQTMLRQQAEELLRQRADRGGQNAAAGGARGAGSSSATERSAQPQSGTPRSAADDMQAAAADLRRGDPAAAADSGRRAAEQLRRLERSMESSAAGRAARGTGAGERGDSQSQELATELDRTRAIRERVQQAERQLRDAEARQREAAGNAQSGGGLRGGRAEADASRASGSGDGRESTGPRPGAADGAPGAAAGDRSGGGGVRGGAGEVERLREAYRRELERAQAALGRLGGGEPRNSSGGMATPEEEQFSRSAPGTEAFKQERSGWESLRKNLDQALEKYETALSDRLVRRRTDDRLSAGGSTRVPEAYSRLIARYFESLATKK